ncbi:MAG: DEAD/DEAH box helicase [Planctomycetota bacterium]
MSDARAEQARVREAIPRTFDAFFDRFPSLLPVQREAVPRIAGGEDLCVAAPTAGGKTEAAVAPLLQRVLDAGGRGVEGPALLYVVPTRALVNDVYRRLQAPLERLGLTLGRKTADHPGLGKELPQVLVTTPESFDSLLCRGPRRLLPVQAVVVDELHALDGRPRGDQCAALLVRLGKVCATRGRRPQLVLLSATIEHPQELAARYGEGLGVVRDRSRRRMAARIATSPFGRSPAEILVGLVEGRGGKVLVFCNARADVEWAARELRGVLPFGDRVFAHHGSLSKDVRERVERDFQAARTALCFATSTLELGIDIGDVDYAVLYGVPPDLPSLLQRVGRAGRRSEKLAFLALARDRGEVTRFRHMLQAAGEGRLLTDPPVYDPGTALQQAASLLFQNPAHEISPRAVLERLPPWQAAAWDEAELDRALAGARESFEGFAPGRFRPTARLERSWEHGSIHTNLGGEAEVEVVEELTGRVLGTVAGDGGDDPIVLGGAARRIARRADGRLVATTGGEDAGQARFKKRPSPPIPCALAADLLCWLGLDADSLWRVESEDRTIFVHGRGTVHGTLLHAAAGDRAVARPGRGVAFGLVLRRGFADWPARIVQGEALAVAARWIRPRLVRQLGFGPWFAQLEDDQQERAVLAALALPRLARWFREAEVREVHDDDLRQRIRELVEP